MYLISEAIVKEEPEEEDKAKQVSPDIHLKMDYTQDDYWHQMFTFLCLSSKDNKIKDE